MEQASSGGFMQLLPIALPVGLTVSAMTVSLSPWQVPAFYGLVATTEGGDPALAVGFEWPSNWLRTLQPLGKFDREWLLIRRFSADQALARGTHAFAGVQRGNDPPDAVAQTDSGALGIESTALTIQARREVHGLFVELRRRLVQAEPVAFAKLAGHFVYVWFEAPAPIALDKPHRRSDNAALEALANELAAYEPASQQLWVPAGQAPQQAPPLPLADTPAGAKFYAVPFGSAVPSTMLFTLAGFEIGLAYTTLLTARDAWDEVQRLVDAHDQAGVDLLLMTAGGPDSNGNVFPVEEAVADFIVANPLGLSRPPDHIKTVILHSWATGRATTLHPQIQALFGPLYQSMVPVHHPITPHPSPGS